MENSINSNVINDTFKKHLGYKVSLLAKSRGMTQAEIAEHCGVSRITVQRFFSGKTEIRSGDLNKILKLLNINLDTDLDRLLKIKSLGLKDQIYNINSDINIILNALDPQIKKTLLNNLCWWGKNTENNLIQQAALNINNHLLTTEA